MRIIQNNNWNKMIFQLFISFSATKLCRTVQPWPRSFNRLLSLWSQCYQNLFKTAQIFIEINNNKLLTEFLKAKFTSEIRLTKPICASIKWSNISFTYVYMYWFSLFKPTCSIDYKIVHKHETISIYNWLDCKFFFQI